MKFLIPSLAVTGLLITSCATTESFVNDDVYSVRPSELPIGESTSDETSYASFKSRKTGNTNDRMTYADEVALANRQNCLGCRLFFRGFPWLFFHHFRFRLFDKFVIHSLR